MKTMTDRVQQQTWLSALAEAAKLQRLELPAFDGYGMGALRSATTASGRFVTLKRRILPADEAELAGVEWALWRQQDERPVLVAAFREPLEPNQENVTVTLSLLKGWLIDEWAPEETKASASTHPRALAVKEPPPQTADKQEYWFSEDRGFGIVVAKDRWSLYSRRKCRSRVFSAGGSQQHVSGCERHEWPQGHARS